MINTPSPDWSNPHVNDDTMTIVGNVNFTSDNPLYTSGVMSIDYKYSAGFFSSNNPYSTLGDIGIGSNPENKESLTLKTYLRNGDLITRKKIQLKDKQGNVSALGIQFAPISLPLLPGDDSRLSLSASFSGTPKSTLELWLRTNISLRLNKLFCRGY